MLLVLPLLASAVVLSGCGKVTAPSYKIDLEVWGIFDDSDAYQGALSTYQRIAQSHIGAVTYRKMTADTYREDLLSAFAEGRGPDVFLIRSSWLPLFRNLIVAAPEYEFSEKDFRDAFVDVAADDLVVDGRTYGAPISVDSLGLYYNKNLLNAAGIATPPLTWDELETDIKLLNSVDYYGNIRQSGVALGTSKNINRSTDILMAMAEQRGIRTLRDGFRDDVDVSSEPMRQAMSYYAGFASIGSERYSWNADQHYSIDAFSEGNLAMMMNYSWQVDAIRKKNAKLNFGVAPLPQIRGAAPANFANYWVFVVAKDRKAPSTDQKTKTFPDGKYNDIRAHESWQFLHYLAFPHPGNAFVLRNALMTDSSAQVEVKEDPAATILARTGQPAARRDLITEQRKDPWLAPFAYGNLIAKGWRVGDTESAEQILSDAIESVNRGETALQQALSAAFSQLSQQQRRLPGD